MLRTLGIKRRLLALVAPVAVVTVVAAVLGFFASNAVTAMLLGMVGVVGVVATWIMASIVASTIVSPLEELGAAADEVAESLPTVLERAQAGEDVEFAEIPVETEDEIGRLTASVNAMSTSTIAFAKGQAEVASDQTDVRNQIANMFVNVARRDQTLLKRLLSQLDQLERSEENPDTLDALFKLDHLATRMRRNAESLLVLAGRESSRRRRQPMPLTDVVRSASSEIEHYERVDLAQYVDPAMLGHSALPTAHLIAELLENATRYSDPGSRVMVETNEGPKGIRITIADTGLGMSADELQKFNERIANPPEDDVIAAEKMGFYVVGRLASKLEATVTLAKGEAKGTVATVDLAPNLFVPGSVKAIETDEHGGDATWDAGDAPAEAKAAAPAKTEVKASEAASTDKSADAKPAAVPAAVPADKPAESKPSEAAQPAAAKLGQSADPNKTLVAPDLSQAADAFAALQSEEMISPEIVAAPSRPGGLPGRGAGLPGRGARTPAAQPEAAAPAAPAEPVAKREPVKPVAPAEADKPAATVEPTEAAPQAPSGLFGTPPKSEGPKRVPKALADSTPGESTEAPFVPSPRTDSARGEGDGPKPGGLFGGVSRREPTAPAAEAAAPEAEPKQSLSSRFGGDARSANSELSSLSRQAPPAPAQPAPAAAPAPAPVAPSVPTGAGALDILPSGGGRGRGRRKQERGAAPMPNAAAIAAAAAAPDEAYVPQAFVPSAPLNAPEGAPAPASPAPAAGGESSLSDVLRARSAMASAALSELSQLSGGAPLARRERGATDAGKYAATTQARTEQPAAPSRPTRSAADVRSMLSGFQAGVNRGRDIEPKDEVKK